MGFYDRFIASSVRDLKSFGLYIALFGEAIGVLFLVLISCTTPYGDVDAAGKPIVDVTRISLTFGFTVATMVWLLANVSGGHINPAVSLGMFITRKISLIRFILYVAAQLIGGIIGSQIQKAVICPWQETQHNLSGIEKPFECGQGLTLLAPGVSPGAGCGIELLITFVLVITVFATCDGSRTDLKGSGPLAIGLSVAIGHLAFVPMTGPSMNPARTFGPAVALNLWTHHWVYWVGPMFGGLLAALIYEFLLAGNAKPSKLSSWLLDADYERPAEEDTNSAVMELEHKHSGPSSA